MKMLSEPRAYPLAFCGLAEGAANKRQAITFAVGFQTKWVN